MKCLGTKSWKMKMILTIRYSSNRIHYLIQRHFNLLLLALIYLSGGTTDIISAAAIANTEEMTTPPINSKNNNNMNNYPGFNKFPAGPFTSSSPNDNKNNVAGSQHAQYVTIWIKARNFYSICTRLEFSTMVLV